MAAGRLRRILYATDFSPASARAFGEAVALARSQGAGLIVLHVLTPPSPFVKGEPPRSWVELEARARRQAERRLARLVAAGTRAGIRVTSALTTGTPAPTIARRARRERADAIVIGTHGRSGLGRLFMGSVATQVLQLAPCPVVTVRGRSRTR
jgi:nucleotide-binding universal stress UspA family protein